jgi:hypothetical protein
MADVYLKITDNLTPLLKSQIKELNDLIPRAYSEFLKNTPVRSGNARRRTTLRKDVIEANYPYAKRLDEGYSKQSPDGMVKPTEDFIEQEFKKIIGKD